MSQTIPDGKNLAYMTGQNETDLIRATKGLSQVGLQWVLKHDPFQTALLPWGVALVTFQQIIMLAQGRHTAS